VPALFKRRRDGRIEVRLNDAARAIVREAFGHVLAAERDPNHEWHLLLNSPINPSADVDDPMATLTRQSQISTNVELAIATLHDEFLNDDEAWAWLYSLQIALRSCAQAWGLLDDERLAATDEQRKDYIHALQAFLFGLTEVL
jgi:hypothetical protein